MSVLKEMVGGAVNAALVERLMNTGNFGLTIEGSTLTLLPVVEEETTTTEVGFEMDPELFAFAQKLAAEGDEPCGCGCCDPEDDEPIPPGLSCETDWSGHGDGVLTLRATFQKIAVEGDGIGNNRIAFTYAEQNAPDLITQLLSLVEEVTNMAYGEGIVPVDFEGLLRGIVDEFDADEAEGGH